MIWVTLVMNGDEYAKGAVVVAKSLRLASTKYPIWVMVGVDTNVVSNRKSILKPVSAECIEFLKLHFDRVLEVPLIYHETIHLRSKKQTEIYGSWINYAFTKSHIFNPVYFPVKKVIFLDADMLVIDNIDDLFELNAPALTFSNAWADTYKKSSDNRKMPNIYGEMKHGSSVSKNLVKLGLEYFVGLGCMMLVEPSYILQRRAEELLSDPRPYGNIKCVSGIDEQFINQVLADCIDGSFTHIHQSYNFIVGKTNWLLNGEKHKTLQWYNEKPWNQILSDDMDKYPDLIEWKKIFLLFYFFILSLRANIKKASSTILAAKRPNPRVASRG
jgi:lipopolysaccharide biosynthesis glycosyltransferase